MPFQSNASKKTYTAPKLKKLTQEQASLILLGQASCGDQGAKDLLDLLYPLHKPDENHDVPAYSEEEEPAQIMPRTSWLIRRAWTVFRSTREDFRRFVRG